MARLRIEISDAADLVRDLVNRREPLFTDSFTRGKWPFLFTVEITLHALETVSVEGPIVIETELDSGRTNLRVHALIPSLEVRIPSSVVGGGPLIKDGKRPLEISLDGGFTGNVRVAETDAGGIESKAVRIDLKGFQVKFHVFPAWVERRLQPLIEAALEDALAKLIGEAISADLPLFDAAATADLVCEPAAEVPDPVTADLAPQQRWLARLAYLPSFYLAYGLSFPLLLIAGAIPAENAAVAGLRDGAWSARESVGRLKRKWQAGSVPRAGSLPAPADVPQSMPEPA